MSTPVCQPNHTYLWSQRQPVNQVNQKAGIIVGMQKPCTLSSGAGCSDVLPSLIGVDRADRMVQVDQVWLEQI